MIILLLAGLAWADQAQDLNCNGIDLADEPSVDVLDPDCAAHVDGKGQIYASADYYYDYASFGCEHFLPALAEVFLEVDPARGWAGGADDAVEP